MLRETMQVIPTALLKSVSGAPRLTIYLPQAEMAQSKAGINKAMQYRKVRFISLVQEAKVLLTRDFGAILAQDFVDSLWKTSPLKHIESTNKSMVFFHDESFTAALPLPISVEERMVVAESFHIKPMLLWLQAMPEFWLLSLSSQRVRLYRGTPWELRLEREVMSTAAESQEREGKLSNDRKQAARLKKLMTQAEADFYPLLSKDRNPVIIAGVKKLHGLYRSINRDPDLVEKSIVANIERWPESQIRGAVVGILGELLRKAQAKARAEFEDHSWRGSASDDLSQVAKAAVAGKIHKLLLASDRTLWGVVSPKNGQLTLHPYQLDCKDDDVLDDLAEIVLSKGGKVLCVPSKELPSSSPVAAIFRP